MNDGKKILIVDDDKEIRDTMGYWFRKKGYITSTACDGKEALAYIKEDSYNIAFVDLRMPGMSGLEVLGAAKEVDPSLCVIIMTAHASIESAISAIKSGAYDYLVKPFSFEQAESMVRMILRYQDLEAENILLRQQLEDKYSSFEIVGKSPRMKEVLETVDNIADTNVTVLIQGASGTGKEVIARLIHSKSKRRNKPFIAANCAAIPRDLLESELFGHEKGAFTGALYTKKGRFELASEGTLLLDEVAAMSLEIQVHLLRVLQEREFRRVGGTQLIKIDVRIIAASNKNLEEEVKKGTFREDLFYRLNVIPINLPPLKERKEDIPLLAEFFLKKYGKESGRGEKVLAKETMELLENYDWQGNVRELENLIERLVILSRGNIITPDKLPGSIKKTSSNYFNFYSFNKPLKEVEKNYIISVLKNNNYNISRTAKILGIERMTLYNKIKKYNLRKNDS